MQDRIYAKYGPVTLEDMERPELVAVELEEDVLGYQYVRSVKVLLEKR